MHLFEAEALHNLGVPPEVFVDGGFPCRSLLAGFSVIKDEVSATPYLMALEDCLVVRGRHIACCADSNDSWLHVFHGEFDWGIGN
jgi:hypothetical protein